MNPRFGTGIHRVDGADQPGAEADRSDDSTATVTPASAEIGSGTLRAGSEAAEAAEVDASPGPPATDSGIAPGDHRRDRAEWTHPDPGSAADLCRLLAGLLDGDRTCIALLGPAPAPYRVVGEWQRGRTRSACGCPAERGEPARIPGTALRLQVDGYPTIGLCVRRAPVRPDWGAQIPEIVSEAVPILLRCIRHDVLPVAADTGESAAVAVLAERWVLNPRQKSVLPLVAQGLSNAEIANRLLISHDAVKAAVASLHRLLRPGPRGALVGRLNELLREARAGTCAGPLRHRLALLLDPDPEDPRSRWICMRREPPFQTSPTGRRRNTPALSFPATGIERADSAGSTGLPSEDPIGNYRR